MKKRTRLLFTGTLISAVVVGVLAAYRFVSVTMEKKTIAIIGGADGPTAVFTAGRLPGGKKEVAEYKSISMEEAKTIFETPGDYLIVDVRRADEFAGGHIPGAIHIANEEILTTEPEELPDKNQVIYVYCRSGRRSKEAAGKLAAMGYMRIPLERNSLHASAGRLSAPNGKFFKLHWITHVLAI